MAPNQSQRYSRAQLMDEAMEAAIDYVQKFPRGKTEAAQLFGVSRASLFRCLKEGRTGLKQRGPDCWLGEFENELIDWCVQREKERRPVYYEDLKAEVNRYITWNEIPIPGAKDPWGEWNPTADWKEAFLRRAKKRGTPISLKACGTFDNKRAVQECVPVVDKHFADLEKVLKEYKLEEHPHNIYGFDETKLHFKVNKGKAFGRRGQQVADKSTNSAGEAVHVTLGPFVRAAPHPKIPNDSQWLPPFVVVADSSIPKDTNMEVTEDELKSKWNFNPLVGAPNGNAPNWPYSPIPLPPLLHK